MTESLINELTENRGFDWELLVKHILSHTDTYSYFFSNLQTQIVSDTDRI
jgi:hypothetical protein